MKKTLQPNPYPQFQIGEYKITVIPVGELALDGGAMFGVVPKVLWNKLLPADEANRIPLALNCLLIEYRDEICLLDTGVGTKFSPKHREMYGIQKECAMEILLEPLGITPDDITKLMFTHLHFDHAGGATRFDESGQVIPTFKNAQCLVHKGEWCDACNPSPKSKASYLQENFMPLLDTGKLAYLEGPQNEILPGLSLRVTGGHTESHQALVLDTPSGGFIYWGDLIPTSHHLKIPYVMAYDLYPVETMRVKTELLKEAHEKEWLNFFEHDLAMPACRLDYNEEKHIYVPQVVTPTYASTLAGQERPLS